MSRSKAGVLLLLVLWVFIGAACGDRKNEQIKPDPETCSVPPGWSEEFEEKKERIRSFFKRRHRRGRFNGSVLFAEKRRILFEKTFGYRNRRTRDSLRLEDPFQLASVSKPFTATLILQLQEEGKIGLNDSLSRFFKDWPYEGVTVKMLLSHRSGLPNYMYFMYDRKKRTPYDNEDVLRRMKKDTPNVYYIPDYRYNYCNTNFCLLALIAERVADTSYRAAMEKWVYEPGGMKAPEELLSLTPEKAKVKGHNEWGSPIEDYPNRSIGDKGLYASARDLYRFDRALRKGKLLADSTLDKAYTPQHDDLYDHDNYGLGWRIDKELPKDRIIWHNGWWKGFRTYFIRLLERDATIIVLNNTTRGPFLNNRRLIRLLYPDRKKPS